MSTDPDIAAVRESLHAVHCVDDYGFVYAGSDTRSLDALARVEARLAETEAALRKIASKRCLNVTSRDPDGSCDWPCVVCVARRALAGKAAGG